MLFSSYIFIFLFLPIVLVGYHFLGNIKNNKISVIWLIFSSLFFYGWWNFKFIILILGSIFFNYFLGQFLFHKPKKVILGIGVLFNLSMIAYFKYANFFVDNINVIFAQNFHLEKIILPLAISFFTFQQIAYLVDIYKNQSEEYSFINYCLFIVFFPQLIAGPIVHHKELLPQFESKDQSKLNFYHLSIGWSIFVLGLFKKIILADNIAYHANSVFSAANEGVVLTFFEAWAGALAYTLQLYFDFSGYSDMAIGLARMFGIILPVNFFSPYKSKSIIEFWHRWHITLSNFLKEYLYFSLGGNRLGSARKYLNLFITMLLGGLWHGAAWNFVFWGGLHGFYLICNHTWRALFKENPYRDSAFKTVQKRFVTFVCVVLAWVIFRAENLDQAFSIYCSMIGLNGLSLEGMFRNDLLMNTNLTCLMIIAMLVIVHFFPSSIELFKDEAPALNVEPYIQQSSSLVLWKPRLFTIILISIMFIFSIFSIPKGSEFLYFNF